MSADYFHRNVWLPEVLGKLNRKIVVSLLVVVGGRVVATFTLVHLSVAAQVGNDGEVASAAIDVTGEC